MISDNARLCRRPPRRAKAAVGFALLDGSVDLSAPDGAIRLWSPELRELVRRGAAALPTLLEHVSDARPTRLVFAAPHPRQPGAQRTVTFSDVYDSRSLPDQVAGGVNIRALVSSPVAQSYVVKVGDLCYLAVGQIVNRRLFVFSNTNAAFDGHGRYTAGAVWGAAPFSFRFVDSPVATPALAAAVRADWHGVDGRGLADSLRRDAAAGRGTGGALCRLLAYDPAAGIDAVHAAIQRVLAAPGEANFWSIDQTISAVSAYWWDGLRADLEALGRRAIRQDRRYKTFADTRENPLATGTAEMVATCARLLVHHGDDNPLRPIVMEEIGRLRREREQNGGAALPAYDYQIGRCEAVLRQLSSNPGARFHHVVGPRPVAAPPTVKVLLDRTAPAPGLGRTMIRLQFSVAGVPMANIAAARVGITTARDDTGFDLAPRIAPTFYHPAVGRVDGTVLSGNGPPLLDVLVDTPPGPATRLTKVQGYVDLVVPRYDPAATVKLEHIAATPDKPVRSAALAAAGVTVTVFDADACNAALSGTPGGAEGPQAYGAQPHFRGPIPKGMPRSLFKEPALTPADIALGIADPGGRVVATEFVGPAGAPLYYNHNGWYHASAAGGRRFDVYRLAPGDIATATLVLQLATGHALVRVPFTFRDVPLPANLP